MTVVDKRSVDAMGDHSADGGRCSISGEVLNPKKGLIYRPPGGRGQYWTCLKQRLLDGLSLVDTPQEDVDALKFLMQETTPAFLKYNSEIELHISEELRLCRPVNLMQSIPHVVFNFEGLRCVDFTAHPITSLPVPQLCRIRSIKRLVLMSCNLRELPDEICDMPNIEQLLLCSNQLQKLPSRLSSMNKLWRMFVDANMLKALPDTWPPYVDTMNTSDNKLTHFPESLGDNRRIKDIQSYGNRLTSIPESLCNCPQLRRLMLHGNRLRTLPEGIGNLPCLESMLLHDNLLERLPNSLVNLGRLEWLYLYNNKLTELPPGIGQRSKYFSRLLIEANPMSASSLDELFSSDVVRRLRVFGADEQQVETWRAAGGLGERQLPRNCAVGRMLPWGRLYAKLMPSSQLAGSKGASVVQPVGSAVGRAGAPDVLVVAFSASQGEPEWMGILGQIAQRGAYSVEEARRRCDRQQRQGFDELYRTVHGEPWEGDTSASGKTMSTLWHDYCNSDLPTPLDNALDMRERLQDFDVLCMCDSSAKWYYDADSCELPDTERLEVEQKLRAVVANYRRVIFLGVSMGGFAALANAHLADTVAVFGPQTDITRSHLRPGMEPHELAAASRRLRENMHRAMSRGTRIEYHVAMEDHLLYARWLPLPPTSLIVHPLHGRIARILERGGLLAPLLIDLIGELQSPDVVRPHLASQHFAATSSMEDYVSAVAWGWEDSEKRSVSIAKWRTEGGLSLVDTTPAEVGMLVQESPAVGAWFCTSCGYMNEEGHTECGGCGAKSTKPEHKVGLVSKDPKPAPTVHQCVDCGATQTGVDPHCQKCRGEIEFTCLFCGKFGRAADGRAETVKEEWYCHDCWKKFDQHNMALAKELPDWWFVEGGQVWTWKDMQGTRRRSGQIEFDRGGKLLTTWGVGTWSVRGSMLEVCFGQHSEGHRLSRTADGFLASPLGGQSSGAASTGQGVPLYGLPKAVAPAIGSGVAALQALLRNAFNLFWARGSGRRIAHLGALACLLLWLGARFVGRLPVRMNRRALRAPSSGRPAT